MHSPEQTVSDFIRAYHAWNERANDRAKMSRGSSAIEQEALACASAEYDDLVVRFCASSVVQQGISYGDESMHDPASERIESAATSDGMATVRTRQVGLHNFVSEYEYRLVREAGKWRIASLLYLDQDGGYECL